MLPAHAAQHDAVDRQPIPLQLVAYRLYLAVALGSPRQFGVQLLVDLPPQPGAEQQTGTSMFDQDGDVLGLWLRLPTAAAQQEVATLALRRPHQTEAQPIRYGVGRRHCRQQRKQ